MKRTLFSCCIWLTSLNLFLFAGGLARADSCCGTTVQTASDKDCVCPYAQAESYGQCHWHYNHCDPTAEITEAEEVFISEAPAECEPVEQTMPAAEVAPAVGEHADYWYDSGSESYYYYDFADEEVVADETAEDALNDLFDFANTETVEAVTETEDAAAETTDVYADEYGYDYYAEEGYEYAEEGYEWDQEDGIDYSDESYIEEVCRDTETPEIEVADETINSAVTVDSEDEYYSEYEDYSWDYESDSYCPEDEVPSVDTAQDVTPVDSGDEASSDAAWTESIVEDPWHDEYDYAYDEEDYEYHYGDEYDYDAEVMGETEWDAEPADESIVEDAWEDEYYSDYEEYYSDYEDYDWTDEAPAAEAVAAETEEAEVVESWDDEQYGYYDDYDAYEYGYEYDSWEDEASEAPAVETQDDVTAVDSEEPTAVQRKAVLSLAHTLDRFGSALQNLSTKLTDMVTDEVAERPVTESTQR